MKKLSLVLAIVLVLGGVAKAGKPAGDDKKSASHGLNIGIPTHAMIGLAGSKATDIDFESAAATIAGNKAVFKQVSENQLWLNYSSIVSSGKTNSISASISELPAGLTIGVVVSDKAENAKGNAGKGSTAKLTTDGIKVVESIGSCYTGSGQKYGHSLVYKVEANDVDYAKIVSETHNLKVTYTITEN